MAARTLSAMGTAERAWRKGLSFAFVVLTVIAAVIAGLAIVLAVVYGLGFLFVGLAIFIPLVILVSLFPVLAPFILLGLGIWWLVRRSRQATTT